MPANIKDTFCTGPEAVEQSPELQRWQVEQIEKGVADIKAGRFKSLDDVRAKFKRKAAPHS